MSSNITATLGGRGLNSVVIRSTPDALSLRGELGSSTVPHKRLVGTANANVNTMPTGQVFMNGVSTSSNDTVLSSDTAFVIEAVVGTVAGYHQFYTLNTNYPDTLVTADTHKVVTTVIGNISEQDDFMGYTGANSAGLIEASIVGGSVANTSDIVVIRRTPVPSGTLATQTTLIQAKILVRLVKRNYVTNTTAAP